MRDTDDSDDSPCLCRGDYRFLMLMLTEGA